MGKELPQCVAKQCVCNCSSDDDNDKHHASSILKSRYGEQERDTDASARVYKLWWMVDGDYDDDDEDDDDYSDKTNDFNV